MGLSRRGIFMVLICAVSAASGVAQAHAIIVESSPAVDGAVKGPDIKLSLRFNSRIDHERSQLTLTGAGGKSWKLTMSTAGAPEILRAEAGGLPPGPYTLRWQVLAVDGHITRGDIPFHIEP